MLVSAKKKIVFSFILFFFAVFLFEGVGHILYRLTKGVFLWESENKRAHVFRIREFTELVNDERFVTNKKNFTGNSEGFVIETDANGFRVGSNRYFSDKENIVFLGDSVPFGWGVDGAYSVPSLCYDMLKKNFPERYGVINVAIPSYSLYQAIQRYEIEIRGKYPVKVVILQTYDPVTQFVIWGRKWNERMSWTSGNTLLATKNILGEYNRGASFLNKYSMLFHMFITRILPQRGMSSHLKLTDQAAFDLFEKENLSLLESFYQLLQKDHATLVLVPMNPMRQHPSCTDTFVNKELVVINRLNEVFRKFASSKQDVYFFDVRSYFGQFEPIERRELFLNGLHDGLHLSETGAPKQAAFIVQELLKNGLVGK